MTVPAARVAPFEHSLRRLAQDSQRLFGASPVQIEALQRIDGTSSCVLRVRVHGAAGSPELFVKQVKVEPPTAARRAEMRDRVEHEAAMTRLARAHLSAHATLSAENVVACEPDDLTLVTEAVAGETLRSMLERGATWYPRRARLDQLGRVVTRVGMWLRAFHSIREWSAPLSLDRVRSHLDIRLRRLVACRRVGFSSADRDRCLGYFDALSRRVSPSDRSQALLHGDLSLSNILIDGDAITLVDFAMVQRGSRFRDLAHLLTQLELLAAKPKFRMGVVRALQHALLEGYGSNLDFANPMLQLFLLQTRVYHLEFLHRIPGSRLSRAYNWHVGRRHLSWLRRHGRAPSIGRLASGDTRAAGDAQAATKRRTVPTTRREAAAEPTTR